MSLVEAIVKLHRSIVKLKEMGRSGWAERGIRDPESVAAHSFSVAILASIFAELRGLNVPEAVIMALIHDLPESVTGDLTPEMKAGFSMLEEVELEAVRELAEKLPEPAASQLLEAWKKYRRCSDPVSRLVRNLDKFEMGLQALEYMRRGFAGAWEIYESALREIDDEEIRRLLEDARRTLT